MSNKSNSETTSDVIGISDTNRLVASILPEVRKQVEKELAAKVMEMVSYQARDAVAKSVREHFEANIGPQVKAVLENQNAEIVAGIVAAISVSAQEAGDLLAKAIKEQAIKAFSDPYNVTRILEVIMGKRY